jgi:hypothetical protein
VRPAVHELITSEIKARAAAMEASRPRVDQVAKLLRSSSIGMYLAPKQRNGINGSSPVAEWGLPVGKAQTDAHELLESVLDLVSQVLGKNFMSLKMQIIIPVYMIVCTTTEEVPGDFNIRIETTAPDLQS